MSPPAPKTDTDPLQRARRHLRQASLEALEGAHALLEAGIGVGERAFTLPADSLPAEIRTALESWIRSLREDENFHLPEEWTEPLSQALEQEITRWEQRSRTDPDARPVLRAFLGFRELVWEFGIRPRDATGPSPARDPSPSPKPTPAPKAAQRVQRFKVED